MYFLKSIGGWGDFIGKPFQVSCNIIFLRAGVFFIDYQLPFNLF